MFVCFMQREASNDPFASRTSAAFTASSFCLSSLASSSAALSLAMSSSDAFSPPSLARRNHERLSSFVFVCFFMCFFSTILDVRSMERVDARPPAIPDVTMAGMLLRRGVHDLLTQCIFS